MCIVAAMFRRRFRNNTGAGGASSLQSNDNNVNRSISLNIHLSIVIGLHQAKYAPRNWWFYATVDVRIG